MLARINRYLTPPRRKAIYGIVTAAVAGALAFGLVTTDQLNSAVQAVLGIVAALTTLMAALNTSSGPNDER